MLANPGLTRTALIDKLADLLPAAERQIFEDGVDNGYLRVQPNQRDLQRLWTLWCMKNQWPDIRVEPDDQYGIVSMHLGPCQTTLSADGLNAIGRAFGRYGENVRCYQTNNWCKHPRVPINACSPLAKNLAQIAYLDGVPVES
jgi:hypothetical protein